MSNDRPPEIDLGKLMQGIREEVARRRAAASYSTHDAVHSEQASTANVEFTGEIKLQLPAGNGIALQPTFHPRADGKYHIDDFLPYYDEEFIRAAYQAVLQRPPDPDGFEHYLNELRNGSSKADILGRLRYSHEGNSHRVVVVGLRVPFTICKFGRWPVVGPLVRAIAAVWGLSDIERRRQVAENHFFRLVRQVQDQDLQSSEALSGALRDLAQAQTEILATIERCRQVDAEHLARLAQQIQDQDLRSEALSGALRDLAHDQSELLATIERRRQVDAEHFVRLAQQIQDQDLRSEALSGALRDLARDQTEILATIERRRQVDAEHFVRLAQQIQDQDLRSEALSGALRDLARGQTEILAITASMAAKDDLQRVADEFRKSADALESSKVEHSKLNETRELLVRALESRVERSEVTALTNYLVNLVQSRPTRDDLKSFEEMLGELKDTIGHLKRSKADCTALETAWKQAYEDLQGALAPLSRQTMDLKRGQLEQERRLGELCTDGISARDDQQLDAMYAAFEDRFRGARADIRQGQSFYLPYIRDARAGTPESPVIDLGCGRGEWLELLRDEGLTARGVDLNRVFIASCRNMQLDVTEQDAVEYLRGIEAASVGAITVFHLIEHLPFKTLISLIDGALRVLRPGGIVIMETPNPENLQVGACNFYTDPTHRNPMPPALTEALLELRGFVRPVIVRRSQEERRKLAPPLVPNTEAFAPSINPMAKLLRDHFYVGPDYAVIAAKT